MHDKDCPKMKAVSDAVELLNSKRAVKQEPPKAQEPADSCSEPLPEPAQAHEARKAKCTCGAGLDPLHKHERDCGLFTQAEREARPTASFCVCPVIDPRQVDDGECSLCGKELPPEARPIEGRQSPLTLIGQSDSTPPPKQGIQVDDEADPSREAQIRERLAKATPGNWQWIEKSAPWGNGAVYSDRYPDGTNAVHDGGNGWSVCQTRPRSETKHSVLWPFKFGENGENDGELIANAPSDLAWLLSQIEEMRRELAQWATWGIVEIAVRNPNVASYVEHWEGRAEAAEAELARMREAKRPKSIQELRVLAKEWLDKVVDKRDSFGLVAEARRICNITWLLADFAENINSRPVAPSVDALPDWISLQEQIPEMGKWCWVVINGIVQVQGARLETADVDVDSYKESPKCWVWADESADTAPFEAVSHWQYVPEFTAAARPSALQQVEAIARDGWVSVKTEMPPINSTVVLCVDTEEDSQEIIAIVRRNYLGVMNNADYKDIVARGYTHWRKLEPQPKRPQG